jgi:hypothetical protein
LPPVGGDELKLTARKFNMATDPQRPGNVESVGRAKPMVEDEALGFTLDPIVDPNDRVLPTLVREIGSHRGLCFGPGEKAVADAPGQRGGHFGPDQLPNVDERLRLVEQASNFGRSAFRDVPLGDCR